MEYQSYKNELDNNSYNELLSLNELNFSNLESFSMTHFNYENEEIKEKEEEKKKKEKKQITKQNKILINKKRGRKAKPENLFKRRTHDKFADDNLKNKIQIHYNSFLVNTINKILDNLGIDEQFKNINYKYKINVNKKKYTFLKKSNIGDILSLGISPKFKTKPNEINKMVYENVIKNKVIEKLLNEKYYNLFRDIYYKNVRYINMEKYGLKQIIILPNKIEMFKEFIEKNKKNYDDKSNDGKKYIDCLYKITEKYFLIK